MILFLFGKSRTQGKKHPWSNQIHTFILAVSEAAFLKKHTHNTHTQPFGCCQIDSSHVPHLVCSTASINCTVGNLEFVFIVSSGPTFHD